MFLALDHRDSKLPLLHRILEKVEPVSSFPIIHGTQTLEASQAYWCPLQYLLHSLVGWADIGKGLASWYGSGKPTYNDPRLSLLHSIWNTEEQLDFFTAIYWWPSRGEYHGGNEAFSPTAVAALKGYGDEDWWRILKRKGKPYTHSPFGGGGSPLHIDNCANIGNNTSFGDQPSSKEAQHYIHPSKPLRAVLIASAFSSWHYELEQLGKTLKPHPTNSWHVEVYDKQAGYLGLFRHSRVTGLWFQGAHSIHLLGN